MLAARALDQGVLKGYVTVDESLPVLRGRLREADQIRRFGVGLPLEVRFDDYSVDIAENRILLAAIVRALRLPGVSARTRTALQRLRVQLADVSVIGTGSGSGGGVGVRLGAGAGLGARAGLGTQARRGTGSRPRPTWMPSRLNARYVPALVVAEMILDGRSFDLRSGGMVVSGFMLNMAQVFEDFVCVALDRALGRLLAIRSGRASLQYGTHLDAERTVPIRPDFVWLEARDATGSGAPAVLGKPTAPGEPAAHREPAAPGERTAPRGRPRRSPVIVADAKYKAEKPSGFPPADLYQMLAYCTVLGLETGHLVYAQGEEAAGAVDIAGSPVRVVRHVLDLEAAPAQVLEQIATIARGMADGLVGGAL